MFLKLLRIYSYLFAIASALAYLALGLISKLLRQPLTMDNMPWKGDELGNWLLGVGLFGLCAAAAAMTGSRLRFLLPIYLFLQLYITIKGNFLGAHSFDGESDFQRTIALSAASVIAALAGLLQLKMRPAPAAAAAAPKVAVKT